MSENVKRELMREPELLEILKRALKVEADGVKEWTWEDVRAYPAKLMKLVTMNLIEVTPFRSMRRKQYHLTELGKKILEKDS